MNRRETVFRNYEHEYAVAGWLGTIGVMQCIGTTELDRVKQFAGADEYIMNVCTLIAKQEASLTENIDAWLHERDEAEECLAVLTKLGIVSGDALSVNFSDAYDIHENPDFRSWLESTTDFHRLSPCIDDLVSYYASRTIDGLNTAKTTHRKDEPYYLEGIMPQVIRDTNFYVGLYDPVRQQPYQPNRTR